MITDNARTELVCPETRQPLSDADREFVTRLTALIDAGRLQNRVGAVVTNRIAAALVRDDRAYAYPVIDGIAKLLVDEAIPLAQLSE